jgi:hypothetical protein
MNDDGPILILKSSVYDTLKFFTMVLFPGLGTLYFGIAQIWGLPFADQVVGTITALVLFLGLILRQSSKNYEKVGAGTVGDVVVQQYPNGEVAGMRLVATRDPLILDEDKAAKFNVVREPVSDPDPSGP